MAASQPPPLSTSAQRVAETLAALGVAVPVRELPDGAHTAAEAAAAIGCAVLVVASGPNGIDPARIGALAGPPAHVARVTTS